MRKVKVIVFLILGIVIGLGVSMVVKSQKSQNGSLANVGLQDGYLRPCGSKPNCASTRTPKDSKFYFPPLTFETSEKATEGWQQTSKLLTDMGLTIVDQSQNNYIHATAKTPLFGFIDDVELQFLPDKNQIEFRSQSRVGYSDLGANKKRLKRIFEKLSNL